MFGSDSSVSVTEGSSRASSCRSSGRISEDELQEEEDLETIIIGIVKQGFAENSLFSLLEKRGNEVCLTEAMVRAAEKNKYRGALMMQMLLYNANEHQKTAVATGRKVFQDKALLAALKLFNSEPEHGLCSRSKYDTKVEDMVIVGFWGQIPISCSRLQRIVSKSPNALEIMETLLSIQSTATSSSLTPRIRITEGWMCAAAINRICGAKLLSLFLRERAPSDDVSITETVLELAASNEGSAKDIFALLFSECREELRITPKVVVAACRNYECAATVTDLLLSANKGKTIRITESMVLVLAAREAWDFEKFLTDMRKPTEEQPMRQLLRKIMSHPYKTFLTPQALCTFAKIGDVDMLEYMLIKAWPASHSKIPLNMLEAAASSSDADVEVMELLLRNHDSRSRLPERVLLAAIGNKECGPDIVEFLFRQSVGELKVTERMLEAALASESYKGYDMVKLLLNHADGDVRITTKMLENAISAGYKLEAALAMLPQAGKHDIQITSRLMRPYAEATPETLLNDGHGVRFSKEALLTVANWGDNGLIPGFLQRNGNNDAFQEVVLIAAITSTSHYEEVLAAFLAQPWDGVRITEPIILATKQGYHDGIDRLENVLVQVLQKYGDAVQFDEEAIEAAIQCCNHNVVQILLEKPGESFQVTLKMIKLIAENEYYQYDILKLLQERCSEIPNSEGLIEALLDKEFNNCISLLIRSERGDAIQLTERLLEWAARKSKWLWDWILWESNRDVQLTERVVEGVASNECGDEMLQKLIDEHGEAIQVTERVVEAAAENASKGKEILEFLLDERGQDIYISERIMEAATRNTKEGVTILKFLLRNRPHEAEITERVLEAAVSNLKIGDKIMDYILTEYGDAIEISERVLEAACRNEKRGASIVKIIHQRLDRKLLITERVQEAAVQNAKCGLKIVSLFLKLGVNIQLTSRVLQAALECKSIYADQISLMLLKSCSNRIQLTENVIEACVRADARAVIEELIESRMGDIQVTERAMGLIAKTWPSGFQDLLQERKEDVRITPKILAECAAGSALFQKEYMERLLQATRGKIRVTSAIVEAAARNESIGEDMVGLLLEQRGNEFKISEAIMREAAKNNRRGAKIINMLIRERGQSGEIRVSERLLEEAAGNEGCGDEIIDLLLQASGDTVQLTDAIAEVAADNTGCGERILELFRMRTQR
jgi:hypothetical protein